MKRFKYKIVPADNFRLDQAMLDLEGQEGWELVCFKLYITTYYAYFKKEIIDSYL